MTELADTTDTNAVLVLQPAVEAFFLVHGSERDEEKEKAAKQKIESQASISSIDLAQAPSPQSPGIPASPSSRTSSSLMILDLPPDTQKFLGFAGNMFDFAGNMFDF